MKGFHRKQPEIIKTVLKKVLKTFLKTVSLKESLLNGKTFSLKKPSNEDSQYLQKASNIFTFDFGPDFEFGLHVALNSAQFQGIVGCSRFLNWNCD